MKRERAMNGFKNIQLLTQHHGGGGLSHESSADWPFNNHVRMSYGAKLDLAHLTKTSLIFNLLEEDCFKLGEGSTSRGIVQMFILAGSEDVIDASVSLLFVVLLVDNVTCVCVCVSPSPGDRSPFRKEDQREEEQEAAASVPEAVGASASPVGSPTLSSRHGDHEDTRTRPDGHTSAWDEVKE